ncbi:carbohydrate ABC transporter permease [Clostridium beijerinckii]|uniref:Sugar ABC transporter permease n=1 Tax=Clostridium beijerinckii TaxID=1520 RepID=A0A1S9N2P2_CLOBE|nr:carbohydrate ABC transporter permease [Clostridium beijerinckii]MZK49191.1 ABC transporter permease subunit [Clostridium beijerinckii]MZK57022.1 ABC transporter permease subunit [Clostridium beijerinckii]MZK67233.1 ABC transporter permease subunit [Clostridium beijerinckii]MZK72860.1 ABC transporter permease subunit [Clostridium beijerinckii]MZK82456.1 ABC transporter permease subunit [Clostridium beijerinckii]
MKYRFKRILITALLSLMAIGFLFSLVLTVSNSFMSETEITYNYSMISESSSTSSSIADSSNKYASLRLIPEVVVIEQYYNVLVKKPQFLFMFWNSVIITVPIVLGQIVVSCLAAFAFAKLRFKGRDQLFFIYIIVMLLPFQVTLVPNYLVADKLGLVNNYLSIILPGIFNTFGVFLMKQYMEQIPDSYIEAAKVDGASQFTIFFKIILPMCKNGIAAMFILVFIDNWNMVEQPLVFLRDAAKQPLSVYLSRIISGERGLAFSASAIYMLPMLLIFLFGVNYLIEGIERSGIKE